MFQDLIEYTQEESSWGQIGDLFNSLKRNFVKAKCATAPHPSYHLIQFHNTLVFFSKRWLVICNMVYLLNYYVVSITPIVLFSWL